MKHNELCEIFSCPFTEKHGLSQNFGLPVFVQKINTKKFKNSP